MEWLSDAVIHHLRDVISQPDLSATRYELLEPIGQGGMGAVYAVRDRELARRVALKVLSVPETSSHEAARMTEEARILARLEHPGIVPVHDMGTLPDGRIFYVMKLVDGTRLDQYAQTNPPLPDLLRVFSRICEPVAFAHSQGIIHRDLKPDNIMVGRFGEVLVLDWGVAKIVGQARPSTNSQTGERRQTASGTVIGTQAYMAPEQAAGANHQVDARSDVYALGMTLRALLANQAVPRRLDAICRKAAATEPAGRYATVLELAADLERYLNHEPVAAHRETIPERVSRLVSRNKALVVLVLAYLAMRILLFLFTRR
jgi:serine/threonine-protein kinase